MESVNTSAYATLVHCASALATGSLVLDGLVFQLADNGAFAGDTAIRFESGAASALVVKNCLSTGGAGFFNQQSAHPGSVTITDNRVTGCRFQAVQCFAYVARICRNEITDLFGSGISAGATGGIETTIDGNSLSWLADCPAFGSLRVAVSVQGPEAGVGNNTILFGSTVAGSGLVGVVIENNTGGRIIGNTIRIGSSGAQPVAVSLGSGAHDGVSSKNTIRIADAGAAYDKIAISLTNGASRNVVSGNNIDMAHVAGGGSDIGIYLMSGCQDNRGSDNVISRVSDGVVHWEPDGNLINIVYALYDIDGGTWE